MTRRGKIAWGLVLALVLVVAAAVVYVLTSLDALVAAAIEKYGSRAVQTEVRVDKVHISLREGTGSIAGLTVANPEGFTAPYAFSLDRINTRIDLGSVRNRPVVIDEVVISAPQVFYEINRQREANLNQLAKRLQAKAPSGARPEAPEEAGPTLIIRRLTVTDGTIDVRADPLGKQFRADLPPLTLRNLGGKGVTAAEISTQIITELLNHARAAIRDQGIEQRLKGQVQEELQRKLQEQGGTLERGLEDLKKRLNR